jgi:hypothetical protein
MQHNTIYNTTPTKLICITGTTFVDFPIFVISFLCILLFEVDKKHETYPVTGKMRVVVPADVSEKELKEIENVLEQRIVKSLGCTPEQIAVAVDPETINPYFTELLYQEFAVQATFEVETNDPTFADEMQKFLKAKDFAENVNKGISKNYKTLPQRIREVLAINDVNVNFLFQNNHNKTKQFQNSNLSRSKFVSNF